MLHTTFNCTYVIVRLVLFAKKELHFYCGYKHFRNITCYGPKQTHKAQNHSFQCRNDQALDLNTYSVGHHPHRASNPQPPGL
jgi:hypothetical protein